MQNLHSSSSKIKKYLPIKDFMKMKIDIRNTMYLHNRFISFLEEIRAPG